MRKGSFCFGFLDKLKSLPDGRLLFVVSRYCCFVHPAVSLVAADAEGAWLRRIIKK